MIECAHNSQRPSVLIVGPGEAFGAELISEFYRHGFHVAAVSRNTSRLRKIRTQCVDAGVEFDFIEADVEDTYRLYQRIDEFYKHQGRLSCLIYNAKLSIKKNGIFTESAELKSSLNVNVVGAQTAIRAGYPYLRSVRGATIILTSGGFIERPNENKFSLSVGKSVLQALAKSLRLPLAGENISMKSIIIDGKIGDGYDFDPTEIARIFYDVYARKDKWNYWVRKGRTNDENQLSLFPDEVGSADDSESQILAQSISR